MPIYPLLQKFGFNPEDCQVMGSAFEACLQKLALTDRSDPVAVALAKKIIELRQRGERDPDRLCQLAMGELGLYINTPRLV